MSETKTIRVNGKPQTKGSGSRKLIPASCPNCRTRIPLRYGIGRLGPYIEAADVATKHQPADRLKRWMAAIGTAGQAECRGELITGPVALKVLARLEKPKSVKRELPSAKPDLDKLTRAVQDALEGISYKGDSQICEIHARKIYDSTPGVDIELSPMSRQGKLL